MTDSETPKPTPFSGVSQMIELQLKQAEEERVEYLAKAVFLRDALVKEGKTDGPEFQFVDQFIAELQPLVEIDGFDLVGFKLLTIEEKYAKYKSLEFASQIKVFNAVSWEDQKALVAQIVKVEMGGDEGERY